MTMKMTRNEMRILFTFGCADREATVTRLFYVGSITVDPTARKQILELAKKLHEGMFDEQYRNFFYWMRADAEYPTLRQYQQDYRKRQSVAERLDKISQQERYKGRYRSQNVFSDQTE